MTPELLRDLKQAEGVRLTAYKDTLGNWTIGVGHLLPSFRDWTGYTITEEQADAFLESDGQEVEADADLLPEWPCLDTPCRQNAVLECLFNLGAPKWRREFPKTRAAISDQNWQAAHDALMDSPLWIKQVGEARVQRIANYLKTGVYGP